MNQDTASNFRCLAPALQQHLLQVGWAELRRIQEEGIAAILDSESDVIIQAGTASGKTEAACMPLATQLMDDPSRLVIFVVPTKALINDLYRRLTAFCANLDIPVTRWHGDVSAAEKSRFTKDPKGFLLITVESVEAALVRRGSQVQELFGGAIAIVVDELHLYFDNERGKQLQSVMHRHELITGRRVRRIGLSATLGDQEKAARFLRPKSAASVRHITGTDDARKLLLLQHGYRHLSPSSRKAVAPGQRVGSIHDVIADLFVLLRGTDNLVFANSRGRVEVVTDGLVRLCEEHGVPVEFHAHHGNLDKAHRERAEQGLKDPLKPATVVATTTIESGVDVGSVASVAQLGNPPSVSSQCQRKGRSGRREGQPSVLRVFIIEKDDPAGDVQDRLRVQTVQSLAMLSLMLEGWVEPPEGTGLHLSTLVHQVLALIAERGGVRADSAWETLCGTGPFNLSGPRFGALLRALGEAELISQVSDGDLVLGEVGERLADHHQFYVAFPTPVEYRITAGSKTLGTVPATRPLIVGAGLIFGGKRWVIKAVDRQRYTVSVAPSVGGRPPAFDGDGALVHTKVRERMREIYVSSAVPPYADPVTVELLAEGRAAFLTLGLSGRMVVAHDNLCQLFPWCGDKALSALSLMLDSRGLLVTREGVSLRVQCTASKLRESVEELLSSGVPSGPELAGRVPLMQVARYDKYLPDDLLCLSFASSHLDVIGATAVLEALRKELANYPASPPARPNRPYLRAIDGGRL